MDTADRFEYKFLIRRSQRDELLGQLANQLLADTHGGSDGHYPIISLYYDAPDLRCYWDNWRGVPSRRKLRVRVYGSNDGAIPPTSFIEVKHKSDGRGVKRRIQTTLAQALAVTQGATPDASFSAHDLRIVAEIQRLRALEQFRPSCVMRYDRHAYFLHLPEEDALGHEPLRVTFDHDIAVRFDDLTPVVDDRKFNQYVLPADHCIMEVKGAGAVPYAFASRLSQLKLYPHQFSKYSEGLRVAGRHLAFAA
jgi:SPX domain protein involved in polyphosphate accumulation